MKMSSNVIQVHQLPQAPEPQHLPLPLQLQPMYPNLPEPLQVREPAQIPQAPQVMQMHPPQIAQPSPIQQSRLTPPPVEPVPKPPIQAIVHKKTVIQTAPKQPIVKKVLQSVQYMNPFKQERMQPKVVKVVHHLPPPPPAPPQPAPQVIYVTVPAPETTAPPPAIPVTPVPKEKEKRPYAKSGWDEHAKNFDCHPTDYIEGSPTDKSLNACLNSCQEYMKLSKVIKYTLHSAEDQICGCYGTCDLNQPFDRSENPLMIYKKVDPAKMKSNLGFAKEAAVGEPMQLYDTGCYAAGKTPQERDEACAFEFVCAKGGFDGYSTGGCVKKGVPGPPFNEHCCFQAPASTAVIPAPQPPIPQPSISEFKGTAKISPTFCGDIGCRIIRSESECTFAAMQLGKGKVSNIVNGGRLPGCFEYTPTGKVEFNSKLDDDTNWPDTESICLCDSCEDSPAPVPGNILATCGSRVKMLVSNQGMVEADAKCMLKREEPVSCACLPCPNEPGGSAKPAVPSPQAPAPKAKSPNDCSVYGDLSKPILDRSAPATNPTAFVLCYAQSFQPAPGGLDDEDFWVKMLHHTDYDILINFGPREDNDNPPTDPEQWKTLDSMLRTGHYRTQYEVDNYRGVNGLKGGFRHVQSDPLSNPLPELDVWPTEFRRDDFERLIYAYAPDVLPRPTYAFLNYKGEPLGMDQFGSFVLVIDRKLASDHATAMYGDGMKQMLDLVGDQEVRDQGELVMRMHNRIAPLNDPHELLEKINDYYWDYLSENPDVFGEEDKGMIEVHIHKPIYIYEPLVREIRVKCLITESEADFSEDFIKTSLICFVRKYQAKVVFFEGDPETDQYKRKGTVSELKGSDFKCFNQPVSTMLTVAVTCPTTPPNSNMP